MMKHPRRRILTVPGFIALAAALGLSQGSEPLTGTGARDPSC